LQRDSEPGNAISRHGGVITDKVAWIRSLVAPNSERVAPISVPEASIRYLGQGVSVDWTAIRATVAQIRSLVPLIRERCC